MREFSRAGQFKRDVKRMGRRGRNLAKLHRVLEQLIEENPLPAELKDYPLRGEFSGSRDCHIEPDWVLIYTIDDNHVRFERTGTHSDLFR